MGLACGCGAGIIRARRMVTVRRATAADAILALTTWLSTSFVVEEAAFRALFEETLARPDMCVLVAESGGGVIGYLAGFDHPAFRANGRVAWVDELGVAEAHQRSGAGRALMLAFEGWAHGRKNAHVALATQRAGPFYEAIGYEVSAAYCRKLL
jgi:GNAT superfamily N-acetyltransferase